ncbi:carbon-nitrogen hydrolase [uncultured Brevibacillus sp.]|uniref:carbon-nitrogen hydrolase n=1 Tax=uncultured Brevibacillus sp. TaxID=169970 RepID=UPI002599C7D4|nr:carbon-nitrogen hydrolase [uncultured Brevibacillus sp.]
MEKRIVKIALIQHSCEPDRQRNINKAEVLIRKAAEKGAQIICTQELFSGMYFPQTIDVNKYDWAEPVDGPTNARIQALSKELGIVTICSFYEYAADGLYFNTATVYDADGEYLGKYRKHHIPEAPRFLEKYYFTPGDTGYPVFKTKFGTIGLLICWDEWFPEPSRILALKGAEIVFYPTAIGVNADIPGLVTTKPWRKAIVSNAIHNNIYVAAPNRVGREDATNGKGYITFYGNSFVADPWGEIISEAQTIEDEIILAEIDLLEVKRTRDILQFQRDRRPDTYHELMSRTLT